MNEAYIFFLIYILNISEKSQASCLPFEIFTHLIYYDCSNQFRSDHSGCKQHKLVQTHTDSWHLTPTAFSWLFNSFTCLCNAPLWLVINTLQTPFGLENPLGVYVDHLLLLMFKYWKTKQNLKSSLSQQKIKRFCF